MADTPNVVVPTTTEQAPVQTLANTQTPDPNLEAFAKKERQLRKIQQGILAEKKAWEDEKAALTKKLQEYETGYIPKGRIKEDFWGTLADAGVDNDVLTQQLINQPNTNDPVARTLMQQIRQLEAKQQAAEQAQQEAVERQYNQAVNQMRVDTKRMLDGNEKYEAIQALSQHDAVVELIKENFEKTGSLMDIEEAADQIEAYLIEEGKKFSSLKKLKTEVQTPPVQPKTEQIQTAPKTLTNSVQAQPTRRLSEKERRERALAAFYGNKG